MEKRKIKKGNDFIYLWSIVRNGLPENLADAAAVTNRKLYLLTANDRVELTEYSIVDGNIVRIEFTPEIAAAIGDYRLELSYTVADDTLADKGRKCTIDVDAFQIVSKSALADDASEFAVTSDMAIGFKGDSAYTVWLSEGNKGTEADYLAYLQSPATEAIASVQEVESTVSGNETLRADAENTRKENETARVAAEGFRETAETTRSQNEASRVGAEELRVTAEATRDGNETSRQTAEALRVTAEQDRQTNTATAIQNAETATTGANNAAGLAYEKADLANEKALLANEKAGLAATATTQANAARDGANSAAQSATNLVNSYATDLAAKELKSNKQNSLAVDGTGTKFPTVDAVNEGLTGKVTLIEVQTPAFTIQPTVDVANNKFILTGLATGNSGTLVENSPVDFLTQGTLPIGFVDWTANYYFVHVVDANSFQLMTTRSTTSSIVNLTDAGSGWAMRIAGVQTVNTDNISMADTEILMRVIYVWSATTSASGDLGVCLNVNVNKNMKYFGNQGYVPSIYFNIELLRTSVSSKKYGFGHHRISFLSNYPLVKINRDCAFIISDNRNLTGATVNADFLEKHTSFILNEPTNITGIHTGVVGRQALWIGNGSQYKIIER